MCMVGGLHGEIYIPPTYSEKLHPSHKSFFPVRWKFYFKSFFLGTIYIYYLLFIPLKHSIIYKSSTINLLACFSFIKETEHLHASLYVNICNLLNSFWLGGAILYFVTDGMLNCLGFSLQVCLKSLHQPLYLHTRQFVYHVTMNIQVFMIYIPDLFCNKRVKYLWTPLIIDGRRSKAQSVPLVHRGRLLGCNLYSTLYQHNGRKSDNRNRVLLTPSCSDQYRWLPVLASFASVSLEKSITFQLLLNHNW